MESQEDSEISGFSDFDDLSKRLKQALRVAGLAKQRAAKAGFSLLDQILKYNIFAVSSNHFIEYCSQDVWKAISDKKFERKKISSLDTNVRETVILSYFERVENGEKAKVYIPMKRDDEEVRLNLGYPRNAETDFGKFYIFPCFAGKGFWYSDIREHMRYLRKRDVLKRKRERQKREKAR